jgi:hypothetical protein
MSSCDTIEKCATPRLAGQLDGHRPTRRPIDRLWRGTRASCASQRSSCCLDSAMRTSSPERSARTVWSMATATTGKEERIQWITQYH